MASWYFRRFHIAFAFSLLTYGGVFCGLFGIHESRADFAAQCSKAGGSWYGGQECRCPKGSAELSTNPYYHYCPKPDKAGALHTASDLYKKNGRENCPRMSHYEEKNTYSNESTAQCYYKGLQRGLRLEEPAQVGETLDQLEELVWVHEALLENTQKLKIGVQFLQASAEAYKNPVGTNPYFDAKAEVAYEAAGQIFILDREIEKLNASGSCGSLLLSRAELLKCRSLRSRNLRENDLEAAREKQRKRDELLQSSSLLSDPKVRRFINDNGAKLGADDSSLKQRFRSVLQEAASRNKGVLIKLLGDRNRMLGEAVLLRDLEKEAQQKRDPGIEEKLHTAHTAYLKETIENKNLLRELLATTSPTRKKGLQTLYGAECRLGEKLEADKIAETLWAGPEFLAWTTVSMLTGELAGLSRLSVAVRGAAAATNIGINGAMIEEQFKSGLELYKSCENLNASAAGNVSTIEGGVATTSRAGSACGASLVGTGLLSLLNVAGAGLGATKTIKGLRSLPAEQQLLRAEQKVLVAEQKITSHPEIGRPLVDFSPGNAPYHNVIDAGAEHLVGKRISGLTKSTPFDGTVEAISKEANGKWTAALRRPDGKLEQLELTHAQKLRFHGTAEELQELKSNLKIHNSHAVNPKIQMRGLGGNELIEEIEGVAPTKGLERNYYEGTSAGGSFDGQPTISRQSQGQHTTPSKRRLIQDEKSKPKSSLLRVESETPVRNISPIAVELELPERFERGIRILQSKKKPLIAKRLAEIRSNLSEQQFNAIEKAHKIPPPYTEQVLQEKRAILAEVFKQKRDQDAILGGLVAGIEEQSIARIAVRAATSENLANTSAKKVSIYTEDDFIEVARTDGTSAGKGWYDGPDKIHKRPGDVFLDQNKHDRSRGDALLASTVRAKDVADGHILLRGHRLPNKEIITDKDAGSFISFGRSSENGKPNLGRILEGGMDRNSRTGQLEITVERANGQFYVLTAEEIKSAKLSREARALFESLDTEKTQVPSIQIKNKKPPAPPASSEMRGNVIRKQGEKTEGNEFRGSLVRPNTPSRSQFSRDPAIAVNGPYYENALEARHEFTKWLKQSSGKNMNVEEFKAINAQMHKTSAIGRNGDRPYKTSAYDSQGISPGKTRDIHLNYSSSRPGAQKYAEKIADLLRKEKNIPSGLVRVPGVKVSAQPVNVFAQHLYPSGKSLDEYFEQGAALLNKINATPLGARGVVDDIAQYYYTMINARPYEQINNSIFMNQVNSMLEVHGFGGMSHGYMDHLAHRLSFDQFKEVFNMQRRGELPLPSVFKIDVEK